MWFWGRSQCLKKLVFLCLWFIFVFAIVLFFHLFRLCRCWRINTKRWRHCIVKRRKNRITCRRDLRKKRYWIVFLPFFYLFFRELNLKTANQYFFFKLWVVWLQAAIVNNDCWQWTATATTTSLQNTSSRSLWHKRTVSSRADYMRSNCLNIYLAWTDYKF